MNNTRSVLRLRYKVVWLDANGLEIPTVLSTGTHNLGLTIPFVLFGIFRYLELVYRHEEGGRPEKVLLTDPMMIVTVLCYLLTILGVFLESGRLADAVPQAAGVPDGGAHAETE